MPNKNKKHGNWFVTLFALVFIAIGVAMCGLALTSVIDSVRMRGWVMAPATILESELEVHTGDESTTYKATARYRYVVGDRAYFGDRVGVHRGGDNLGSFHQDAAAELERYRRSGETFRCYYNPTEPEQSVLYRDLRWERLGLYAIIGLIFGGFGIGLIVGAFIASKDRAARDELRRQYPDKPWMWKPDWACGVIRSSTSSEMRTSIVFSSIWNLISWPLVFLLRDELAKENYLALIGLAFPITGVGLAVWAIRCCIRWKRDGESTLQMGATPGVIGGPLVGVVRTKRYLTPSDGFRVTLSCIRRRTTRGRQRNTHETVLWQDRQRIVREMASEGNQCSVIPIQFVIPSDAVAATVEASGEAIIWQLEVKADVEGVDFAATFEVPVFRTENSSSIYVPEHQAVEECSTRPQLDDVIAENGVRVEWLPAGGMRVVFPALRNPGACCGLGIFTLAWSGFIALMIHLQAPIFFPIVFGLFNLLLLIALLDLLFWSSQVDVTRRQITISRALLAWRERRAVPRDDVDSVSSHRGMQSGRRLYYDVQLLTKEGGRLLLGKRLRSKAAADTIAAKIAEVLSLDKSTSRAAEETRPEKATACDQQSPEIPAGDTSEPLTR